MFFNKFKKLFSSKLIGLIFLIFFLIMPRLAWAEAGSVLINEIAWMGTNASQYAEWIELYNTTGDNIDLSGWTIFKINADAEIKLISLQGVIVPQGYFLIERVTDSSPDAIDIVADISGSFGGSGLKNTGEYLVLKNSAGEIIDSVNASSGWPAGDNTLKASMERKSDGGWQTNDGVTINGYDAQSNPIIGTPKAVNSNSQTLLGSNNESLSTSTPSIQNQTTVSGLSAANATSSPLLSLKAVAGDDILAQVNQNIVLDAVASQGADHYKWYLGDGSTREGQKITYNYPFPGTYLVTLEATNEQKTSWDQLRVYIFGGRPIINEIMPDPNQGDSWLELYNQQDYAVDLSGWILTSNDKNFVLPNFVIMAKNSFLILPKSLTGLDFSQSKTITLKYPNGSIVDQVNFDEIIKGVAAARNDSGFFWTGEPTPGSNNVVVLKDRKINSQVNAAVLSVADKSENKLNNLIASSYNKVAFADEPEQSAVISQDNFWQKLFSSFWLWLISVFGVALIISFVYLLIINKSR